MRTFQHGNKPDARFWTIEARGRRLFVTHGKVGTRGREQTVDCPSAAQARADLERRVQAKLRDGYLETTPLPLPPLQLALESALVEGPDDLSAHMAYADYLSEQDDPQLAARGELIQVQLSLEEGKGAAQRKKLQQREKALLKQHRAAWLGGLAPFAEEEHAHFVRGWLDSLLVPELTVNAARALANAPETRLLRRLALLDGARDEVVGVDFARGDDAPEYEDGPCLYALQRARFLGNLRVLHVGDVDGDHHFHVYPNAGPLLGLLARLPRLRELGINARQLDFEQLLDEAGTALPELRALRLERMAVDEFGCDDLIESGMLARLKLLQLWNARLDDRCARVLARSKALGKLDLLDVSFNFLTPAGLNALKKTGVKLLAEYQVRPEDFVEEDEDDLDYDDEFDDDWE